MICMSIPLFVVGIISQQINKEIVPENSGINALFFVALGVSINALAFLFYGPVIKRVLKQAQLFI